MIEQCKANRAYYFSKSFPRMSPAGSSIPHRMWSWTTSPQLQVLPSICTLRAKHIMYPDGTHLGGRWKHRSRSNANRIWIMVVIQLVSPKPLGYEPHHRNFNPKGVVRTSARRPSPLDFTLSHREWPNAHTFHGFPKVFKEVPNPLSSTSSQSICVASGEVFIYSHRVCLSFIDLSL